MPLARRKTADRTGSALISLLARERELSRKDLARLSGLPLSTVTDVTRRLLDEHVLQEAAGDRSGRRGRPATVLRLNAPSGAVAVLGVGRAGLQAGIVATD